jgi:AraC family transcriptional regulator
LVGFINRSSFGCPNFVLIKKTIMDNTETISVRGMVCNRCILSIKEALDKIGVRVKDVHLGKVGVYKTAELNMTEVRDALTCLGFEILVDREAKLVETVKEIVRKSLNANQYASFKFSAIISARTKKNYDTVSAVFSGREGITVEHYIINQKIERVKHLLATTDLSLTDISYLANYSSVHHLSKQFKEIEGTNASYYRALIQQSTVELRP